jgi:hypothetical protein
MEKESHGWPKYLFKGRMRTSTAVLIVAFLLAWWLYANVPPPPKAPVQVPATQVVPPGFVPDPNYTWVPRTAVRQPPTTTPTTPTTTTPTTATTTTPTATTTTPTTTSTPPVLTIPGLPPVTVPTLPSFPAPSPPNPPPPAS